MIVNFFIFLCVVLALSDSAAVDGSLKCGIDDGPCQMKLIQNFIQELDKEGGGSLLDPYKISKVSLNIDELIEATLTDGSVKGLKDCVVTGLKPNLQIGRATLEAKCDHISVKGHYNFSSSSPALQTLLGASSIHGDGNAKIKLDKVYFKIVLFYKAVDRDGDIYFVPKGKKVQLIDLQIGKATFNMDKIFLGKEESSEKINDFLNKNSELIIATFGRPLANKVLVMGMEHVGHVFTSRPATSFIIDDLRPFVKLN